MMVNYGGSQLSCSDSSNSSLIIFLRGCPYNCYYCHNKELQDGEHLIDIEEIKQKILESLSLISEVILSGGEPGLQILAVKELAKFSKELNLKVGIETSGYNSRKFLNLLKENLIDEIFLDIKTFGSIDYFRLTGSRLAWNEVINLINICKIFNINLQVRTTVFTNYPEELYLNQIKNMIEKLNLPWKQQEGRIV